MAVMWKRESIEKLIELFKQHECLYNVKSESYLDRAKKAQSLTKILKEMRKIDTNFTLDAIKKKWKNLRTQYLHSQRQKESSKNLDCSPKLWCYDKLSFLENCITTRASRANMEESSTEYSIEIVQDKRAEMGKNGLRSNEDFSDNNIMEETPNKKLKTDGKYREIQAELDEFKNILMNRKVRGKEYEWLGMLVSHQMEEIHPDFQSDAAWEIQCLIRKYIERS